MITLAMITLNLAHPGFLLRWNSRARDKTSAVETGSGFEEPMAEL